MCFYGNSYSWDSKKEGFYVNSWGSKKRISTKSCRGETLDTTSEITGVPHTGETIAFLLVGILYEYAVPVLYKTYKWDVRNETVLDIVVQMKYHIR